MIEILKNSQFIDMSVLQQHYTGNNIKGEYWAKLTRHVIGVNDLRARNGVFTTPWNANIDPIFAAPALEYTNKSLSEILDSRAVEISKYANDNKKRIVIQWSGGIDSTTMLSSFIKNLNSADLENITVALSTNSILENPSFYKKFISEKLECINWLELDLTDEWFTNNLMLHGDPADCLYGPSGPAYSHLVSSGDHLMSHRTHRHLLYESLEKMPGFGKWYVDKISAPLDNIPADNVQTIADWWWWHYFNFKWFASVCRPLYFCRSDLTKPIRRDLFEEYVNNTFYNTHDFQLWSYSNLQNLIGKEPKKNHKAIPKKYIFELNPDPVYFESKRKYASKPTNQSIRDFKNVPFVFDKDWKGHYWSGELGNVAHELMDKF